MNDLRSTAAIKGHPIHPMLVPIPITLFIAALVSDIAFVTNGSQGWATASQWLLGGGLAGAALAAVAGSPTSPAIRGSGRFAMPGCTCSRTSPSW